MARATKSVSAQHAPTTMANSAAQAMPKRPEITVVDIGDGLVRVVNCAAAAKFCGVSSQAFGRVIRRALRNKQTGGEVFARVKDAVKRHYPEFF